MLKGISPVLSPDLLKVLCEMGHGDEIVISDAHFPAHSFGRSCNNVLRADGLGADKLLAGLAPLFQLDQYVKEPVVMMAAVPGDTLHINGADILLVAMTTKHRLGRDVFLLSFRLGDAHRDLESERYY